MVYACQHCNCLKGGFLLEEFLDHLYYLERSKSISAIHAPVFLKIVKNVRQLIKEGAGIARIFPTFPEKKELPEPVILKEYPAHLTPILHKLLNEPARSFHE